MNLLTIRLLCIALVLSFPSYAQNETPIDIKYKRSSLYTFMVANDSIEHADVIKTTFESLKIPEKFNDHIVSLRVIPKLDSLEIEKEEVLEANEKKKSLLSKVGVKKKEERDQLEAQISAQLTNNDIAKAMIAKWFNRSEKGGFNMTLISERGFYNASDLDIKVARSNERGLSMLADAGEELIKNTFVIVNNYKYTSKEEVAKKTSGVLNSISSIASKAGNNSLAIAANATSKGVEFVGKGYIVKSTAYLYKLVWNDEVASIFYNDFWTDDENLDLDRKKAFDETDIFKLDLVGIETSWADVQSTSMSNKGNDELIALATIRATDNVIAKLQRKYEVFRTKTPLLSGDPLSAKIGLKEGLEKGDKYEVLEQVINKEGLTEYKRVGVIKVDKSHIWDNRYLADEENNTEFEYTTFSGPTNKYFSGMLIRQIN
ncbi:hypothetical protein PW52_07260 [Tamlana sedimentorum]|uniref:Uncharacterized protein n=1 Tax=Neotamlana sedimentorum TaxID=1435349 RepID=A0A0D7WCS7_9FLAO|nr:hypothetical protein [Tamlana sedimentorum]KJD35552.1 hypothetical protein PW52_07260 [Tamlana sedimentorum]